MTERNIIRKIQPVISYLIKLQKKTDKNETIGEKSFDDLKKKINKMHTDLLELDQAKLNIDFNSDVVKLSKDNLIKNIKYVMTVLCDEIIIYVIKENSWKKKTLEFDIFKSTMRGNKFYGLYAQMGKINEEISELFYICIAMGFRGDYKDNLKDLESLKSEIYNFICKDYNNEIGITKDAKDCIKEKKKKIIKVNWKYVLTPCCFIFVLFAFWWWWLYDDATVLINETVDLMQNQKLKSTY